MWRFIIFCFVVLYCIYYSMVLGQFLFNVISFTNRKLTFFRAIVPFYFWIVNTNEKPKSKKVKPIIIKNEK